MKNLECDKFNMCGRFLLNMQSEKFIFFSKRTKEYFLFDRLIFLMLEIHTDTKQYDCTVFLNLCEFMCVSEC